MNKKLLLLAMLQSISCFGAENNTSEPVVSTTDGSLSKNIARKVKSAAKNCMYETYQAGKIASGSTIAAMAYGIANDMVTARICPEYFTEGFHKDMIRREPIAVKEVLLNPNNVNQIALWWGRKATWWFGAGLSIPVIAAARLGSWPKLGMEDIAKPLTISLGGLFALVMATAGIGYRGAKVNPIYFRDRMIDQCGAEAIVDHETRCRYVADACAHNMAYAGGAVIAAGLVYYILQKRYQKHMAKYQLIDSPSVVTID